METKRFISYQEGELFVGWLEEYPRLDLTL